MDDDCRCGMTDNIACFRYSCFYKFIYISIVRFGRSNIRIVKKSFNYKLVGKMFVWSTEAGSWHFVPISKKVGQMIKDKFAKNSRGFGSLPVEVTIGKTVWKTSIFPEKTSGSYILPVKAMVRKAEKIEAGDEIEFSVTINI